MKPRRTTMPESSRPLLPFAAIALAVALPASMAGLEQRTFATPQEAAHALLSAAEAGDIPALSEIFGPDAAEILNSGDPVEDKNNRERFVKRAQESMKE